MAGLFLGELFRWDFVRRTVLLFGGAALAFLCNVARTTYLVLVCDRKGLSAVNLSHDQVGFTILGITFAGLLLLTWLLRPRGPKGRHEDGRRLQPGASSKPYHGGATEAEGGVEAGAEPRRRGTMHFGYLGAALLGLVVWVVLLELAVEYWFRSGEQEAAARPAWSLRLPSHSNEFRQLPISEEVRDLLRYDQAASAAWRDVAGRTWQLYYLRWLPAKSQYRAAETIAQARGHAPDVCLGKAGMILQTNLGTRITDINGVRMGVTTERFLDQGRRLYVLSAYWEPNEAMLKSTEEGTLTPRNAIRRVARAVRIHDRGANEKRVLKIGVWDLKTDEAAEEAFRECLLGIVQK
jgi:exosortase/archaeosortase family protein